MNSTAIFASLTALNAAQTATNATLRSNGVTLWCVLFISVFAFILAVTALFMAQKALKNVEKRQSPSNHEYIKEDTMPDTKPAEITAQTMLTNIESDCRVFAPRANLFASSDTPRAFFANLFAFLALLPVSRLNSRNVAFSFWNSPTISAIKRVCDSVAGAIVSCGVRCRVFFPVRNSFSLTTTFESQSRNRKIAVLLRDLPVAALI